MYPEKISPILNFTHPRNTKDVVHFLGMLGYFSRLIYHYAAICVHLTRHWSHWKMLHHWSRMSILLTLLNFICDWSCCEQNAHAACMPVKISYLKVKDQLLAARCLATEQGRFKSQLEERTPISSNKKKNSETIFLRERKILIARPMTS
ncbi:hypothetical protein PR048_001940 [Dryococelus australis]|uniref:Uncharacterized protein n=1 Tax=Dryococelus australis TaxID=614101 RepID=A0ABQ9IIV4_9NEOP|nr:hypothetical protein PR048_001940 [Dryococelus australis]